MPDPAAAVSAPPLALLVYEIVLWQQACGRACRDSEGVTLYQQAEALLDDTKNAQEGDFHRWLIAFCAYNDNRYLPAYPEAQALLDRARQAVRQKPPGRSSRRQNMEGRQHG